MPDTPLRIIDVMALTVSDLLRSNEVKRTLDGQQLVVSLFLCILDWCMVVPLPVLIEGQGERSEKRLIRTVFKALHTAATIGRFQPKHRTTHSYTLNDLKTSDFDPDLELNQLMDQSTNNLYKLAVSSQTNFNANDDKVIGLAAQIVLSHLTNHLGHFPLRHGSGTLSSLISEFDDLEAVTNNTLSDLSPELFASPNVQFLIYNNSCLMSVVEIPKPPVHVTTSPDHVTTSPDHVTTSPDDATSSADRCVRFIIRDGGGKYSWDASLIYGPRDVQTRTAPVHCKPLTQVDDVIRKSVVATFQRFIDYDVIKRAEKPVVVATRLGAVTDPDSPKRPDKLDRMLQYLSWSSSECHIRGGIPLNTPAPAPRGFEAREKLMMTHVMKHHQNLAADNLRNCIDARWKSKREKPTPTAKSRGFHHARLLLSQLGFISRGGSNRSVELLQKNELVLRNLRHIDNTKCRETHKIAVIYIAPGQEDKISVLSNEQGSEAYENFVAGLGWEVDLENHRGFSGRLQKDKLTGKSAPYFATSSVEAIFHVATRFSTHDEEGRHCKLKHIGNDEVHIVWSDHHRDYRLDIIPTDFGDVVIVIYPLKHQLYRIDVLKKKEVPSFGPLYSGAIVNGRTLSVLVRETAINAGRAKRSNITYYQRFYEERARYLQTIIDDFRQPNSYEVFGADLFQPGFEEASPSGGNRSSNNNSPHYIITPESVR